MNRTRAWFRSGPKAELLPLFLLFFTIGFSLASSGCAGVTASNPGGENPLTIANVAASNISSTAARITWSTNLPATSQVEYGTTANYGASTPLDSNLATSHAQALSSLQPTTLYHYRVRSRDANNREALSPNFTFTTTAQPDTTPPTISGVNTSNITPSTATITWSTNEPADSLVEYGTSTSYGQSTPLNASLVTNHSMSLASLTPSTLYHYRVQSKDAAGNLATSSDFTFTTTAAADTTPPTVSITSPASGATVSGTVTVSASASDNVGVVGVQFLLDGANLGPEDTTAPYTVSWNTTTAANGTHTLSARARDAAGNTATSAPVSVSVSNSPPPPPPTGTSLGALAAQMLPGTWAELTTNGLNGGLLISDTAAGSYILQYMDKVTWDSTTRQLFFVGGPHTGMPKFVAYSDASNTWRREPDAYWWTPLHGYQHNTINVAAGELYHRPYNTNRVYKYKIGTKTWSDLPPIPMASWEVAGALEYFPERNGLLFVDGDWGVFFLDLQTNQWTQLANTGVANNAPGLPNLPMGPYHNFASYSPTQKAVLFGGGNGSSDIYKLDPTGKITKLRNAPMVLGVAATIVTVDPVSGNYLVFGDNRTFYEYDIASDSWRLLTSTTPPFFDLGPDGPVFGTIATPVSTYGVVLFVNFDFDNSKVYLYKHSASTPPPADTTPPTVSVASPVPGTTVSGTVNVSASASDNVGVAGVQFLLDGANLGSEDLDAPYSISWNTAGVPNGTHTLAAKARDATGNLGTSADVVVTVSNVSPPPPPPGGGDFAARCQTPGVLECVGFDSPADIAGTWGDPSGVLPGDAQAPILIDAAVKASGNGSMKFTIPSNSGSGSSGSYFTNFSNDLLTQFGEGGEFYIQWRQRFSSEFLNTFYTGGGGWKQIITGTGDLPGCNSQNPMSIDSGGFCSTSCTQLEVVVQNTNQRGGPQMYHSCGGKDGSYEPLDYFDPALGNIVLQNAVGCLYPDFASPPCVKYKADQWMTFQVRVKIGTWYKNDRNYHRDSTVQLWVAEEGQPSKLVIDFSPESGHGYDLANTEFPFAKYGKVWLLPYHTNKDPNQAHPTAYTWYDELIISRSKVPDPAR